MGLGGDRAQRHGAGGEALDDFLGRLDFVERNGLGGLGAELEQAAQGHVATRLVVDELGVFLVAGIVVGAGGMLQLGDGIGVPHVFFAAHAEGIVAARVQSVFQYGVVA